MSNDEDEGMMRLILITSILILCGSGVSHCQPRFIPVEPEVFSNSFVRCFHQDSKGYMWLGTADGLLRYDGTNLFRYEHSPQDKFSIPHNNINAIAEDANENIWIGTSQGLCLYNREHDNFIDIDSLGINKNALNNRYITSLAFQANGDVLIGTYGGGINVLDHDNKTFTSLNSPQDGRFSPPTNYITSILVVDEVVLAGTKGGLLVLSSARKDVSSSTIAGDKIPATQLTQVVSDKQGNIWLSSANGDIYRLTPAHGYFHCKKVISVERELEGNSKNILTLCFDVKGNLWIAGDNTGLNYLDTRNMTMTQFVAGESSSELPTNSVRSVYMDRSGMIWIGTFNKGAYKIDDETRKFTLNVKTKGPFGDLTGKNVRAIAEDRNGNIWISIEGTGLLKLDAETNSWHDCAEINSRLINKHITSIIFDRHDNMWIGTTGKGAFKLDSSGVLRNFSLSSGGFGEGKVSCFYEDKAGTIWAGTLGSGLFYFDAKKGAFISLSERDKPNYITPTSYVSCLVEDAESVLWVGTMYGLYALRRDENSGMSYDFYLPEKNKQGTLSSASIQALYEDRWRNLWIGTVDNGLNLKQKSSMVMKVYLKDDGLASNTIRGILGDASGNVWISGNRGISKYELRSGSFTNYTREDGLASNDFYAGAALRTSPGRLFFGSNNGLNAFFPDSISVNDVKPVVSFSDLRINNQSIPIGTPESPLEKHISLTSELCLTYDQRSFAIDFVAIDLRDSRKHSYCYKLQGFEQEWNCIGANHTATYTNIDPGEYVLMVKASNRDGVWSESPAQMKIIILPTPWRSWWAITLYVAVVGAIAYFFFRFRIDKVEMKSQLALERVAREREHELSESKTQFFTNISHEFRTPLSLILMPLESLATSKQIPVHMRDKVLTAYKSADKMMHLVNELMDFNKLESGNLKLNFQYSDIVRIVTNTASVFEDSARRRNIRFTAMSEQPEIKGWIDADKLEKITVNVLSNAFKFTRDGGRIRVELRERVVVTGEPAFLRKFLELVIIDNGIGISAEELPRIFDKFYQAKSASLIPNPGTGIGLSLTKGLVELHNGSIKAESSLDHETRFTILIPLETDAHKLDRRVELPDEIVYTKADTGMHAGSTPGDHPEGPGKPEVIIAEDNDELRRYIAAELRDEYRVIEARDGVEALEIALERCPDLVISDVLMPHKNGDVVCQALRQDLRTSHIPFIMLTAKTTVEDQISGIESGADIYITKPFSIRVLQTYIRQVLSSRRRIYEQFLRGGVAPATPSESNKMEEAFLQRAVDFIREHIQDTQLGVDALAGLFHMSHVQFYRKIKALTGKTAVEFIRSVRLMQAVKLMASRQYTFSEIAFQTGFSSASYFTRSFKEEFGKAPSDYFPPGK